MAEYTGVPRNADTARESSERKLRVLLVLNSYQQDGPGNLMFHLCQRLVADPGLVIETVSLSRTGELLHPLRDLGISSSFVSTRGRGGMRRLLHWADEIGHRTNPPDVIHTNLLWPDLVLRFVRRRIPSAKLACTIHGLHAVDEKGAAAGVAYRVLDRFSRSRVDAFVAISGHVRETMLAAGYPADRTHVITNGVDAVQIFPVSEPTREETRYMLNVEGTGPLIVCAGNLIELKGPFVSLKAFALVREKHPDATLVFIGEGPLRDALEREAEAQKLPVRFIGHLSRMLPQVLGSADVVVHPSRVEGFGLIVAETLAAGTPVVCGDTGGMREVVQEGISGHLVDPQQPSQIAARVLDLLADRHRARAMGMAGREHVAAHFEIGRTADAYLALWKKLCSPSKIGMA